MTEVKHLLQQGFSLVELMISLLLGSIITGTVIFVFLSNKETYRQNDSLVALQENARYAFEIIGRDIREAGAIACGSNLPTANVLNNASNNWWSNWDAGLLGFEANDNTFPQAVGTTVADRVADTDALIIHSATSTNELRILSHNPTAASFLLNTSTHGLLTGDVVMVCDYTQAAILQLGDTSTETVTYDTNGSPGNCSKGLGYPSDCSNVTGTPKTLSDNALLTKLSANAWYVGNNSRGSSSLYRVTLVNNGGAATTEIQELAEGVTDLQIQYLEVDSSGNLKNDYVDASSVTDWHKVIAARWTISMETDERTHTDGSRITRKWYSVFTLRNRTS